MASEFPLCLQYGYSITAYVNGYYKGTDYYYLYSLCTSGYGTGNIEYGGNTGGGGGGGGGTSAPGGGSGSGGPSLTPNRGPNLSPCAGAVVTGIGVMAFSQAQTALIFSDNQVSDSYGVSDMINQAMNYKGIVFDGGSSYPCCNAVTDPSNLYPVTTQIQNSYINKASSLSLARTIIHETMHAYFQYALANYQTNPNINNLITVNNLLFSPNGTPYGNQNTAQHNQMAQDYVAGIALMLANYANYNGIQSPDPSRNIYSYCEDMAWGGLEGTAAFSALSATDQTRIHNTMFNEQEHNA